MNKKVRKTLKISGFILLGLFLLILIIPVFFQKQVMDFALKEANKMLNAKVSIENCRLSLIRSFPNPAIVLRGILVENIEPFEGDTLLKADEISASINLFSVFSDTYHIKKVLLKGISVNLLTNVDTLSNWDIVKPSDTPEKEKPAESSALNLKFDKISIENANIRYEDVPGGIFAGVRNFDFELSGNLSSDRTTLKTAMSAAAIDLKMGGISYLNKLQFSLKSKIDADLKNARYTVLDNEIRLNALLLQLEGWVAMPDEPIDMDIKLTMPQNEFKNILSLIPAIYAKDFKDIKADGKVAFQAFAKGRLQGEHYPAFGATLNIENARFQYSSLPAGVTGINLNAAVASRGGSLDNTIIDIKKFGFAILSNPFELRAHIAAPISDPDIDLNLKGVINLADIKKIYPLEAGQDMSGVFNMDVALKGLLSYVEKEQYDKFDAEGSMNINSLIIKDKEVSKNDIHVPEAELLFTTAKLNLTRLSAAVGRNSIAAAGYVQNYLTWIFKDGTLKGALSVNSDYLNINDFMPDEAASARQPQQQAAASEPEETAMSLIQVPANLDIAANLNVKKLIYDNINMDNAQLACSVRDAKVTISNLAAQLFAGSIRVNGSYSAPTPRRGYADLDVNVANISCAELCKTFALFSNYLPVLNKADGKVSVTLRGNTALDENMSPVYEQLNLGGVLSLADVKVAQLETLSKIAGELKLDKLQNIQLKDIKVQYAIERGKLRTSPFDFKVDRAKVAVESGTVGLDKSLDYTAIVAFPTEVLGAQTVALANSLAAKAAAVGINANVGQEVKFAVKLGGTLTKPTVSVGLDKTRDLIGNVVEQVKEQVIETVKETVNKALEEAQKQADALVASARKTADDLVAAQKKAADKVLADARAEADKMIAATKNPLEKAAKKVAAEALLKEAQKKADKLNADAQARASKMVSDAQAQGNALIEKARQK
ncbi:MAG: AsmA family protein [Bacteroidales bacterium]|jgi:uncharacterized protein involved in outer membrane biogenesis/vacuolar-type H+-ATPase subunit H|nr:AsmA family protein [Bacteroidales bacterium]